MYFDDDDDDDDDITRVIKVLITLSSNNLM